MALNRRKRPTGKSPHELVLIFPPEHPLERNSPLTTLSAGPDVEARVEKLKNDIDNTVKVLQEKRDAQNNLASKNVRSKPQTLDVQRTDPR